MTKIVVCTGGFDPVHSGHISYFKAAHELGDKLVIGLNSDDWLTRKKGRPFLPFNERKAILEEFTTVDQVIEFDDANNTACDAIQKLLAQYPTATIVFVNGGDRQNSNTPELDAFSDCNRVEFEWGVGGANKANSSSWILDDWKSPKTIRPWGWYRVLEDQPGYKVKELVIEPGKSLSNQRHFKRDELWTVLKGSVSITTECNDKKEQINLAPFEQYSINKKVWHLASNNSTSNMCHILEVQHGVVCDEDDIERKTSY